MADIELPYAEQWFSFEDRRSVELTIELLHTLKIPELRTCFSWADWERPGGQAWFDWFIPQLHDAGIRLMPCLFYTPIQKAMRKTGAEPRTSFPPERLEEFAAFTKTMLDRYGHTFDWLQLWNEPNWHVYWDQELDPDGKLHAQMIDPAIDIVHVTGKRVAIGGLSPYEPSWLVRMFEYGVLQKADAVGIHAFPGTWDEGMDRRTERPWQGLAAEINDLKSVIASLDCHAEAWYTETGYSTFGDERQRDDRKQKQIAFFEELIRCGADRTYWHAVLDQAPETPTDNELNVGLAHDIRAYHFGLADVSGKPKPIVDHWKRYV